MTPQPDHSGSVRYGVLRDASGYRTHRHTITASLGHIPKYHVPGNESMTVTACGLPAAEFTACKLGEFPDRRRCQKPGCRERWPNGAALDERDSDAD